MALFIDLTGLKVHSLTVLRLHCGGHGLPLKWECRCDCGNLCIIPGARLRNWNAKSCGCYKMTRFINLVGQKFNMLTVVSLNTKKNGITKWNCVCDCGNTCVVKALRLGNGNKKNCGCVKQKSRFMDLTGQKFNMLIVLSLHSKGNGKMTKWNCKCDCGNDTVKTVGDLRRKRGVISCGCMGSRVAFKTRWITHGLSIKNKRLYAAWINMKNRCTDPEHAEYHNWGGRGISFCKEWEDGTVFFEWALNNGYKDNLVLDRKDNDGNYTPENCRWITGVESRQNTSHTLGPKKVSEIRELLANGETMKSCAIKYNVTTHCIYTIKTRRTYKNIP